MFPDEVATETDVCYSTLPYASLVSDMVIVLTLRYCWRPPNPNQLGFPLSPLYTAFVCVCGHCRESSHLFLPPCDIIALAPSRTKYCIQKINSDHRLIVTLNLGDSHLQLVLVSSPMNKLCSKAARLAPVQSVVRIRQPGQIAERGDHSRSPRPIANARVSVNLAVM